MSKTIGIVSLSSGILGEETLSHSLARGLARLKACGVQVRFLPHALDGVSALKEHPEHRAADLIEAFRDPTIDMILCAIGGDDTYRLLPYLFDGDALRSVICQKPFLGFSDTTINHLMLHKLGVRTCYGQSFLADVCELAPQMLPYTARYFEEWLRTGTVRRVTPSDVWYEERDDFSPAQIDRPQPAHPNDGFQLLQGSPVFSGRILGGCIDSMFDIFDGTRYMDMPALCRKYDLFPSPEDWKGRILLLETSEELMPPEKYEKAVIALREAGVFSAVSGVLCGKPMNEAYDQEYREILLRVIGDPALPVVWNLNIGHATPRCILPFGVNAAVDATKQEIVFDAE
jgi:muramoyltetrapeptide carboxypeptidase LdcA involved in peptidoglycan recycling